MKSKALEPIHPGELLLEEFLQPLGLSQYRLAKGINVPPRRINEIVHGKRSVTADTALRLARFFGTTEAFWLNLQAHYDLEREEMNLGERLEAEVKVSPLNVASVKTEATMDDVMQAIRESRERDFGSE